MRRLDRPPRTGGAAAASVDEPKEHGSGRLGRAAVWMATGTAMSRLTGMLRIIALTYALGIGPLATSYNLANTTPNMIYDIVLGGILAATFIPVFVDRLATRDEHEAWRAISAIVSAAVVLLVAMTVVFWLIAPEVISAYTAFQHSSAHTATRFAHERALAVTLLRWFVPQVALYGFISLMTALLNTRRRFAAPAWVPIVNNVVVIGMALWFHAVMSHPSLASVQSDDGDIVLLGLGTTLGVALQVAALVPAMRGVGLGRLRWRWDPRHEAVRTVVRLGGWTFGFVVLNQVAVYVATALAYALGKGNNGPVSSYTYAFTFMLMPYAVVAMSVMSAVTPDLAERWTTGDDAGFRRRLTSGMRATLAIILPASMGMLILARPVVALLLAHGSTSVAATRTTAGALAMFAFGLPGFCAYLYVVRVLQAMQRTKVAFWLYLVENGLNVIFAFALVHPLGVRGLALSLTIAYSVAAVVGVVVLRRWLGRLGAPGAWAPLRRSGWATLVMGAVVLVVSDLSGAQHGAGLFLRVAAAVVAGVAVYGAFALVFGGRQRPLALLTGEPRQPTATGWRPGARLEDVGVGAGLGAAWGDARVPVNTGPRIRIVPAPGTVVRGAKPPPEAGPVRPVSSSRGSGVDARRAPRGAPGVGDRVPVAPDAPVAPEAPDVAGVAGAATVGHRTLDEPARARSDPGAGSRAGGDPDNADDVGERRWIGGTTASRRGRPPR